MKRRAFLRGAAGTAIALPFLPSIAHAQTNGRPKRLIVLFSPNGTIHEQWSPDPDAGGIGDILNGDPDVRTDHSFNYVLQPLEAHRQHVTVVDGVKQTSTEDGPGDGHQKGMGHMLTGTALQERDLFTGGNGEGAGWAGGISVDQHIANVVGSETRFASLELGALATGADVWARMSYTGAGQPVPPENDPNLAFNRIFSDLATDPVELVRLKNRRRSVLDLVRGELESLTPSLAGDDRVRVDQHLTAVREIELRLNAGPSEGCVAPAMPGPIDPYANDNFPAVVRLQMDQLVMAMACDLTRVGSLQMSQAVGGVRHTWQGINTGHHALSHDASKRQELADINRWYAEQVAYLIDRLANTPDGDGSLLDNTVVVWTNELGDGESHSRERMPYVLAGSAGGALRTGLYVRYPFVGGDVGGFVRPPKPHNNLLLTLCRAMGLDDTTFGDPSHCTGVLDEILT